MARQVIWGILPDDREQPRIEFGEDTTTKEAFLSINGMDVNPGGSGNIPLESGKGTDSVQQLPRADRVTQKEGETAPHFDFTGHTDAGMAGRVQYGAIGDYSASMNGRSAALNKHAFAINNSTVAKGEESFAAGYETIAEGNSSMAGGSGTYAKGKASVALGTSTKAEGESSVAIGLSTVAKGIASFASGYGTEATGNNQVVIGTYNEKAEAALFIVGNGDNEDAPHTAFSVWRDGSVRVAKEPVVDDDVVRLGDMNIIKGPLSSIKQKGATVTGNIDSAAAFNQGRVAESGAFATGSSTASGWMSTATGVGTKANGSASFTAGVGTKAGDYQAAFGIYNVQKSGTLFEIGNGSESNPLNIFEVYNGGDLGICKDGKIYSLHKMLAAYFTDTNLM